MDVGGIGDGDVAGVVESAGEEEDIGSDTGKGRTLSSKIDLCDVSELEFLRGKMDS